MTLLEQERDTYRAMFAVDEYLVASPGVRYLPAFQQWAPIGSTVLDAGAGPGAGTAALHEAGYRVAACDLERYGNYNQEAFVAACLWDEHQVKAVPIELWRRGFFAGNDEAVFGCFDYVYCCDVLEHLPPAFTMLAVRNLLSIASKGLFLSIAFMPDGHGAWVGKHLHQTVQPYTTWRDQLREIGRVVDARDLALAGLFFLEPRR